MGFRRNPPYNKQTPAISIPAARARLCSMPLSQGIADDCSRMGTSPVGTLSIGTFVPVEYWETALSCMQLNHENRKFQKEKYSRKRRPDRQISYSQHRMSHLNRHRLGFKRAAKIKSPH